MAQRPAGIVPAGRSLPVARSQPPVGSRDRLRRVAAVESAQTARVTVKAALQTPTVGYWGKSGIVASLRMHHEMVPRFAAPATNR